MEFVNNFNLLGVEAKQIPCFPGKGAPTSETEGAVGCLYMDTSTGDLYKCVAVNGGVYTWEPADGGTAVIVVTLNDDYTVASHTSGEIYSHVQTGGIAMMEIESRYLYATYISEDAACFAVKNNDMVDYLYYIDSTGAVTTDELNYAPLAYVDDMLFHTEPSDGINKFNPHTVTREVVANTNVFMSDIIPCKVGDVLRFYYKRNENDTVAYETSCGIYQINADGKIGFTEFSKFGQYTVQDHVNTPDLIGVRIMPREIEPIENYGIDDLKRIMVTVNYDARIEGVECAFYPWSESEKVNRIEKLEEQVADIETASTLADKKVLIIGDSISTDSNSTGINYGNYEKWVMKLIKQGFFSAEKVTNDSIHATGFVASLSGDGTDCFLPRLQAVQNPEEYDIVIVFGGINDFIKAINYDTFKGAVDAFFEYLTNTFINSSICILRPLRTSSTSGVGNYYQTDYSEYIGTVAKSYCLPVLNLTEESGFYPWIESFKNRWTFTGWTGGDGVTGDGVHPNEEWEETRLAPMIKTFLKGLI